MSNRAWVTLATNDSYGLGALVLAHSLRRAASSYPAVVLITPSVTEPMRERLRAVFAEVILVDVLDSKDATHLALLQRPELGITFTKIHCWSLTQYEKCVFLDADTLIVQNCDELFEREELSAAPDVGWPDCFNSGVFVFAPSADTFSKLITFASERGSFDGGDQGLLNSYFSDWAHGDINKHLPFLYNVTSAAFYSYIPALKHYGQNLKIIHFIGAAKPWLQHFNWQSRSVEAPEHLRGFLQLWWDLFVAQVHLHLDTQMTGVAGNLARVVPGAPQQQDAVDELTRRQGWEAGNIDYMGADSFDNIWAKISQTLSQPPSSPPRQSSPPKEQPIAVPVEEAKEVKEVSAVPLESKPEESIKGITPSEVPSETSVAVEAPVVAPEVVAAIEAPISSEISENVAPAQAVETVASTETSESVPPTEVPACVFTPEASDCVSHPEVPEPVVQVEATECVSPSKVSETVAPIEATCVSPPQASENVPSAETKESTASSETTASVVTGEATEIVSLPEATATVTASVAPPEATESVSPPEEAVSVVSTEATESVSPPEAAISVASTEATESVSPPEAVVSVASTEPTESVSQPEAAVNVASTKATESVSSPEAGGSVVPTEATESVSPPEATVNVLSTKATESVSPPEATVNVPSTEATESVSPPVATGSVAPTETTESVSPSEATVSVAPTEGSATVTPPDAAKNVAPTEAIESISLPEATAFEPIETEETVPSSESPAAAASIEEPVVDVPVPVIEAAESAGKQEDSIPVPVETAAVPAIIPAETKDIPVSADEAVKIDNVCASPAPVQTTVPAVENESEPSLNKSVADSESFTDKKETTSEQALDKKQAVSDSPPLANTPSKEEIPIPPAAKTEERRKPAGKLSLPPACCDTLPTPDSEVEDAASLAHAIIAGELRTPTVTSPSPPVIPPLAQTQPTQPRSLSVDQPDVPTPPIESSQISLTQIAVKSKPSIASQIETSVSKTESTPTAEASEAPKPKSDAPKKKIIKKVVKKVEKEAAPSGDAPVPVPPPRKKEKKPKEK